MELRKWRVVDQQGITTEVVLLNPEFGVDIPSQRFAFDALDLPSQVGPSGRDR